MELGKLIHSGIAGGTFTLNMMLTAIAANAQNPIATAKIRWQTEIKPIDRKQCPDRAGEQPDAICNYNQDDASKPLHGEMQRHAKPVKSIDGSYDLEVPRADTDDWIVCPKATSMKPKIKTFRDWLLAEAADDTRRLRKMFGSKL